MYAPRPRLGSRGSPKQQQSMTPQPMPRKMDAISELFLTLHFRIAFLEKKGIAFQDWFVALAGHAFGPDFEAVRPYGNQGDWKCDGRQLSTGTIFQCYAPETERDQETIAKINDDFSGALAKWPKFIRGWTFVHNDPRGVPPAVGRPDGSDEAVLTLKLNSQLGPNPNYSRYSTR